MNEVACTTVINELIKLRPHHNYDRVTCTLLLYMHISDITHMYNNIKLCTKHNSCPKNLEAKPFSSCINNNLRNKKYIVGGHLIEQEICSGHWHKTYIKCN